MALLDDARSGVVYSSNPVLLLFADREHTLDAARAVAERAGCRIAGAALLTEAVARFDTQIGADAVLLSVTGPSSTLDAVLEQITKSRIRGVVTTPAAMLDVFPVLDLPMNVDLLLDPRDDELEDALAQTVAPTPAKIKEINRGASLLQQLSEDAARIASVLASLSVEEGTGDDDDEEAGEASDVDASFVRGIIRARRLRDQFFKGEIFADPAFDTLLDLYAARLEGRRVAVSSLCIAASVPATTALRWIRALTEQGLFVRNADPNDGRRVYIGLSDEAARAMGRYLSAVQKASLPAV